VKVSTAVAEVLKKEGLQFLIAYPVNPIIETAAGVGIRTIIVRQERTGLHMAEGVSRVTSGDRIGVFATQQGPGIENSFGGIAQAYANGTPLVVLAAGYERGTAGLPPNFNSFLNMQHITRWIEQVNRPQDACPAVRRALTQAVTGTPGPAVVEFPIDILGDDVAAPDDYRRALRRRVGPDLHDIDEAAEALVRAERPVIYAGQGVHYARAWSQLKALAELVEAPVTTSLEGKSAFPENHPLSLGNAGRSRPGPVAEFLKEADLILGIGCSFTSTAFGTSMPPGKIIIHATLNPIDLNKELPPDYPILGDAGLVLDALLAAVGERLGGRPRGKREMVAARIAQSRARWLEDWMPKLTCAEKPLNPYRVLWDLLHTVDVSNTVITHDSGGPRDQLSPFWSATTPLSYIGWGKTTQLGAGLGLIMGAKLALPERLCINVWGDAAIGFTGMDLETAVREHIPILSVLLNNSSMACELPIMKAATERFRSTDISGNYAEMANAFGAYGERVVEPDQIVPAIRRAVDKTREGCPALLEFITSQEIAISTP
jgi:thiamine pyrophosphate-dependent acetolactate synthase large subunit-like protein